MRSASVKTSYARTTTGIIRHKTKTSPHLDDHLLVPVCPLHSDDDQPRALSLSHVVPLLPRHLWVSEAAQEVVLDLEELADLKEDVLGLLVKVGPRNEKRKEELNFPVRTQKCCKKYLNFILFLFFFKKTVPVPSSCQNGDTEFDIAFFSFLPIFFPLCISENNLKARY